MATQMVRGANGRFVRKADAQPVVEVVESQPAPEPELETAVTTKRELNFERVPWAQNMVLLPRDATEGASFNEILEIAGLDWEVEFGALRRETPVVYHRCEDVVEPYVDPRPRLIEVTDPATIAQLEATEPENLVRKTEWRDADNIRDVRRADNKTILGSVGRDYELVQNYEGFRFADMIVDDGQGRWVAAGDMYDGSHVYGVMELSKQLMIDGNDAFGNYLLFRTSHNGSTGVQVMVIPMRFTCDNMMQIATRYAKSRWSMRHVGTFHERLQEARDTLKLTFKYLDDGFTREIEELLAVPMTDEKARWTLQRVIPDTRAKKDEIIDGVMDAYHDDELNGYTGTGYGLLNGLTDYFDHRIRRQSTQARFIQQTSGEGAKFRNTLTKVLLHLN